MGVGSELTVPVPAAPATGAQFLLSAAVVVINVPLHSVATSPLVGTGKLKSDSDVLALEIHQNAIKIEA